MHLVTADQIDELRGQLGDGKAFRTAQIGVEVDPFDFARTGAALVDRAVAYASPDGLRLAGLGTAWRAHASGTDRFRTLADAVGRFGGGDLKGFLGFSFLPSPRDHRDAPSIWDGFAPAEVFVPRISILGVEGGSVIRVAVPEGDDVGPTLELLASMRHPEWQAVVDIGGYAIEPNPPVSEWARIVEDALGRIDRQEIDKVVLARSVVVHSETPPSILRMFRSLVESYPQCYNFAWKSGDAVFMGASPELLAKVAGRHFHSNPLAGSAPRGEGLVSDEAIGNELLHSKKDLREHALVVEDLKANLEGLTETLTMAAAPSLKKMASVQHLSTEITGLLNEGNGLLDVVEAVHPTPAVGGSPTIGAIAAIDALETIERGWYTGGVGWVDANGDGTVALALRCGLIRGVSTHLFAGAGIVEGSRPDDELDETRLKLEPLMRLLTAT